MRDSPWLVAGAVVGGLLLLWLVLIAVLWFTRPDELRLRDLMRLLPDLVRLLRRLAGDRTVPRGVRVRLWLLIGYLAMPTWCATLARDAGRPRGNAAVDGPWTDGRLRPSRGGAAPPTG
jgi:hypothetical protein